MCCRIWLISLAVGLLDEVDADLKQSFDRAVPGEFDMLKWLATRAVGHSELNSASKRVETGSAA